MVNDKSGRWMRSKIDGGGGCADDSNPQCALELVGYFPVGKRVTTNQAYASSITFAGNFAETKALYLGVHLGRPIECGS
jgi:hypothetical protein